MACRHILILSFFIWGFILNTSCSSQTKENVQRYPACERRSNTDPGRLTIRAGAEDFGMAPPCIGKLELYINPNSQTRSLVIDLEYLNMDDELVHQEQLRTDLKPTSTGMFQNEATTSPVQGATCRTLQMVLRSITCYSSDGIEVECPDVRVIPPDAFYSLKIDDQTLNVCSAER